MSEIIDSLPSVAAIDAKIAALRAQERDVVERSAARNRKYHAARIKWESEAVEAELAGAKVKSAPEPPDAAVRTLVLGRIRNQIEQATRARQRAILDAADEIREQVEQQGNQILDEAREPLQMLGELVPRLRQVASAVDAIADARVAVDPSQATNQHRRPPHVDLVALIDAADRGLDVVLDGRDPRQPQRLGFTRSNLHEPQPERRAEPLQPAEPDKRTVTVRGLDGKPMT